MRERPLAAPGFTLPRPVRVFARRRGGGSTIRHLPPREPDGAGNGTEDSEAGKTSRDKGTAMDFTSRLDPILIQFYQITGYAFADYLLGTFLLALASALIGKCTISLTFRFGRAHMQELAKELNDRHRLSLAALHEKDDRAFRAINNQATEAYGRYYFNLAAHSMASLWPVPFVLEWMQDRFHEVELPFIHPLSSLLPPLGYFATFVLCYILARMLLKLIPVPAHNSRKSSRLDFPLHPSF